MMKRILNIIIGTFLMSFGLPCLNAQKLPLYEIIKVPVNSDGFSEISPVIIQNGILFCSDRRFSSLSDRTAFDGHRLYNIYVAENIDSIRWQKPRKLLSERSNFFNNGPLCITSDGKTVYFTSEVETGKPARKKNYKNHNGIFIGDLSEDKINSLRAFKYNNAQYQVGQPSISSDGRYLYFVSDMPGGRGKSDIYCSEFLNGEWTIPVNLGPKINSQGTENFPFSHTSGKLYFSSDRPGGSGKLDVYSTSFYNGEWDDPVLLPEPINSNSDDFAFVASENLQTGYFSSNRSYNDDIFRFSSTIIRKATCDSLIENNFCYQFLEENAVKFDTLPFLYQWKFGDGSMAEGAVVEHCYSGPGKYIVQLDVVNLITREVINNQKTDTLLLENIEQPYISGPDTLNTGQSIKLDASSTNLPGWKISQYYWNFGDQTVDIGEAVEKSYSRPGSYNIQLIVTTEPETGGLTREACVSKNINVIPAPRN